MIPYIDKSLSGKIEFIYEDVVVKKRSYINSGGASRIRFA